MPGASITWAVTARRSSFATEARSRSRTSTKTQPEGRAFSLLSIGGPSARLTLAMLPSAICCPPGVRIGSSASRCGVSRNSRG